MTTLPDLLAHNVRNIGDKAFLIADAETLSFRAFDMRCAQLAHVLARRGVRKGDRVGLYLPSAPLMVIGFWACQKLGAIAAPMSAMLRETEVRGVLGAAGVTAIIADAQTAPLIWNIRTDFPALRTILVDGAGDTSLAVEMANAPSVFADAKGFASDVACLFFTSGTTGAPKGVTQTQLNQCASLRDMAAFHRSQYGSEIYYCAAPLFSNLGLTVTINLAMHTGGAVVLPERWRTEHALASIKAHRVTMFIGTPTMFVYLVNAFDAARHDLSSLRICTNGGAPVSPVIAERFEAISGAKVLQVYGATEVLGQVAMEPVSGIRKPGSAGLAVGSARIDIIDESGAETPAGIIGEARISGDTVSPGYWSDGDATAKSFTPKGWLSGDLGYLDEDGYLFIVDRKKDLIISGGHNIQPIEVENVLYRHPGVAMCCVLGLADSVKGEIPVAIIVRAANDQTTGAAMIAFCKQHLSAYKAPRQIYFTPELPISAGKVRKRELRELIEAGALECET